MARPSKNYTTREQIEGRAFQCLVYVESESYNTELILNRLGSYWDRFYYVLHDNDFYSSYDLEEWEKDHEDSPTWQIGDKKKPHYHVIGYRDAPLCLGLAAQKFGVPSHMVQKCKSLRSAVRYLRHLDHSWKSQYAEDVVISNDPDIDKYWVQKLDALQKGDILLDFITSAHKFIYLRDVIAFSLKSGSYDELRRGQHLYTALIKEQNEIFGGKELSATAGRFSEI